MPKLAIHQDFLLEYGRLDTSLQRRVCETFKKFADTTHTGIHLEKIQRARNPRFHSIRIDSCWRGVVLAPEKGDTYLLLKVLPHDEAYAWACRRDVTVNMATGGIEIRDDDALTTVLHALTVVAERTTDRLFTHVNDSDMRRLGIDEGTLAAARAMTSQEQLDAARGDLPSTQWDVLLGLAAGLPVEQVWSEIGAGLVAGPIDAADVDTAVRRSPGRVVIVEGPAELLKVFADPFALWRIYLHPSQQEIVDSYYRGPARVTGGPGTGKTVVALHRSRRLAERGAGRILLTTFTSTLADSLRNGINTLVDEPGLVAAITVSHVDQFANSVFRQERGRPHLLDSGAEAELWRQAHAQYPTEFTETFLAEEWRHVILAQNLTNGDEYRDAARRGRGRQLGRVQKSNVWEVAAIFERLLVEQGVWTWETLRREATRILHGSDEKPFRHIIIDEAQDLGPDQWRLLRAAVSAGPDDLFIAGDTHQRIYNHRVSLRDTGIGIVGRSRRLSINYRTTAEILAWSLALLRGQAIDDMDGGLETIAGCRSEIHGPPPELEGFRTQAAELDHIAKTVHSWLDDGVKPEEIGIATRFKWVAKDLAEYLADAGVATCLLARETHVGQDISVGTMHRMKGLEFRCMIVAGIGDDYVPAAGALTPIDADPHAHGRDLQRERCLLFVACTRAREHLLLTWHGQVSRFVDAALSG